MNIWEVNAGDNSGFRGRLGGEYNGSCSAKMVARLVQPESNVWPRAKVDSLYRRGWAHMFGGRLGGQVAVCHDRDD